MKVAILGDSVTWGQGLHNYQKLHTLALQEIATTLGMNAKDFLVDQRAHSGAVIAKTATVQPLDQAVTLWQEVPFSAPTIWQQVPNAADLEVKLVILDGGINDVNFINIVSPNTEKKALDPEIKRYCYQGMLDLLTKVRRSYPNAIIIVTGYYPILSEKTPTILLALIVSLLSAGGLALFGTTSPVLPAAVGIASLSTINRVTNTVRYFANRQLYWLRRAVMEKQSNDQTRGPGILFAHPAFSANNALGAPNQFLFSPQIRGNIQDIWNHFIVNPLDILAYVDPTDPMASQRETACAWLGQNFSAMDKAKCALAGVGHPNQAGAQRYADVIARNHKEYARISVKESLRSVQETDGPLRLREIMQRFNFLAHQNRFKNFHQHFYIDCLNVKIKTKDEDWAGTDQSVKLRVGRRREWKLAESIFQGDDVDEFERGKENEYAIDPAGGNPNNRMHLSELKEITLILEPDLTATDFVDLGKWIPQSIEVSINGQVIFNASISKTLYPVAMGDFANKWTAVNFPRL